jgi:hypothetical protein
MHKDYTEELFTGQVTREYLSTAHAEHINGYVVMRTLTCDRKIYQHYITITPYTTFNHAMGRKYREEDARLLYGDLAGWKRADIIMQNTGMRVNLVRDKEVNGEIKEHVEYDVLKVKFASDDALNTDRKIRKVKGLGVFSNGNGEKEGLLIYEPASVDMFVFRTGDYELCFNLNEQGEIHSHSRNHAVRKLQIAYEPHTDPETGHETLVPTHTREVYRVYAYNGEAMPETELIRQLNKPFHDILKQLPQPIQEEIKDFMYPGNIDPNILFTRLYAFTPRW